MRVFLELPCKNVLPWLWRCWRMCFFSKSFNYSSVSIRSTFTCLCRHDESCHRKSIKLRYRTVGKKIWSERRGGCLPKPFTWKWRHLLAKGKKNYALEVTKFWIWYGGKGIIRDGAVGRFPLIITTVKTWERAQRVNINLSLSLSIYIYIYITYI
jgi:hypothetical protein